MHARMAGGRQRLAPTSGWPVDAMSWSTAGRAVSNRSRPPRPKGAPPSSAKGSIPKPGISAIAMGALCQQALQGGAGEGRVLW